MENLVNEGEQDEPMDYEPIEETVGQRGRRTFHK